MMTLMAIPKEPFVLVALYRLMLNNLQFILMFTLVKFTLMAFTLVAFSQAIIPGTVFGKALVILATLRSSMGPLY